MKTMPRTVWALGFVSLLMDTSSELIHALLPVFLVTTLGASTLAVGIIEGVAEAATAIVKVFSGVISDWIGKRKPLLVLGYGLAALTKPLFPLAASIDLVVTARLQDRIGKGIRGAPRDALVADVTAPEQRGAAFGLRQSLDTVGAFLGPLLAIGLMFWFADDIRSVLWFAVPPAFLALALLVAAVPEPEGTTTAGRNSLPISRCALERLSARYWGVVVVGAVLTVARFSEAFLILRAQDVGLSLAWIPMVLVTMSAVYALAAYPAGLLSDQMSRLLLLMMGMAVLIGADLVLAWLPSLSGVFLGAALWGLHMGLTQGLLASLVADAAPVELRGTGLWRLQPDLRRTDGGRQRPGWLSMGELRCAHDLSGWSGLGNACTLRIVSSPRPQAGRVKPGALPVRDGFTFAIARGVEQVVVQPRRWLPTAMFGMLSGSRRIRQPPSPYACGGRLDAIVNRLSCSCRLHCTDPGVRQRVSFVGCPSVQLPHRGGRGLHGQVAPRTHRRSAQHKRFGPERSGLGELYDRRGQERRC